MRRKRAASEHCCITGCIAGAGPSPGRARLIWAPSLPWMPCSSENDVPKSNQKPKSPRRAASPKVGCLWPAMIGLLERCPPAHLPFSLGSTDGLCAWGCAGGS